MYRANAERAIAMKSALETTGSLDMSQRPHGADDLEDRLAQKNERAVAQSVEHVPQKVWGLLSGRNALCGEEALEDGEKPG